ncbi:MAG: hypothetical protein HFI33_13745 [Lachnospiraceae bacterium]|nr:hypothetical protein [Lachnospiraceae bacterium]
MGAEFWDDVGRKLSGAAEAVGRKTSKVTEIARLKNQIYALERGIQRDFATLGKQVYEKYLETQEAEEGFLSLCEAIAQEEVLIEQYKGEIEELKEKN